MAVLTPHEVLSATERGPAPKRDVLMARLAALAGAVFFGLIVAGANLRSGAPSATDTGREIVDYVTEHQGRLQLGAVLMALAMPAALFWLGGLFRIVRRAEGGTSGLAIAAVAGGALAAAGTGLMVLLQGVTALRIDEIGVDGARVWWAMSLLSAGVALLGLCVLIGATAVASMMRRIFARWFTVASVFLALASAAGACTIGYDGDGIQIVAGLAILFDSVWILLVSIFLWRDPGLAADELGFGA